MLRDLKLNVFYPYSPERVWRAIANRRALAAWLMENDFEPRVGHKFRFQADPQQGFEGIIYCEVIEIDAPRSLSYTWRGSFTCKPTIVTWKLLPVEGGTQVQLEHTGFESEVIQPNQPMHLAPVGNNNAVPKAMLETKVFSPIHQEIPFRLAHRRFENFDSVTLNFYLNGGWHWALNSRFQNVLTASTEQVVSHQ